MKKLLLILTFITLGAQSAFGTQVKKNDWINAMTTALPAHFCKSDQFFRHCFKVSEDECIELSMTATKTCLLKHRDDIPDILNQPKDGRHWGTIVGNCVGETYGNLANDKFINNDKCNNISNWK